ncbi:LysR substrate-binding domain-containing protein [Robbsia sp. Bb-Pol-6]|uniref:LysR substrate-binding domain-containing protein n=1 Tax=Robbsia betulipollinis TaxID=2981849 RepID=A0ABT3ZJJ1_9BURK|nr:LysR substrate-binding domain-containing protein [Robbsia betulipollinis]MCY0386704.1 LysR substrate-binding domain-containing protein [Robbsia betulipollinis]
MNGRREVTVEHFGALGGLEVFVQTARTQSFAAAGRALGISASAVSKSVSRLEERVGVRLFQRSTRAVRLTSEGDVFLERCKRILGEVQAAEDDLSAMTAHPRGRLRVGLSLSAGLALPVLSAFMAHYPEIELDLDFTDRLVDLIDEGFDVLIRGSALNDSRLVSRALGRYRGCLVASPAYLEKKGTPTKPADLLSHACLHYRWSTTGKLYRWPLSHATTGASGLALPTTLVCTSLDALLHMALAGRGVTCVPDFSVRHAVADGRLKTFMDNYLTDSNTFHVVWASNRQLPPKVRVFVDFMIAHFSAHLVTKSEKKKRA